MQNEHGWRMVVLTAAIGIALGAHAQQSADSDSQRGERRQGQPQQESSLQRQSRVAPTPGARARLRPTEGQTASGVVEFTEIGGGQLAITVELAELSEGKHGLHIHETGDCSAPDASSAGEHFSPDGRTHGAPSDTIHHSGDLGNVTADSRGIAVAQLETRDLELSGPYGIVNRAVIVHAGEDDLTSQPSGNSGDPIACGVIRAVAARSDVG